MANTILTVEEASALFLADIEEAGRKLAREKGIPEDEATMLVANALSRRLFFSPMPKE